MVDQARKLAVLGATDYEVAQFFDINESTLHRWKHTHPELVEALTVGKEAADERVKRALYSRAVGYNYDSEKIFHHQGVITRAECVEHVPPDPGAAFNWLKNRDPDNWRDRQERHHTGNVSIDPTDPETARQIIARHEALLAEKKAAGQ